MVLFLLPAGFILSVLGLIGVARQGTKGILVPATIGVVLSLLAGVPFSAGFIHSAGSKVVAKEAPSQIASASVPTQSAPKAAARRNFAAAPYRTDMVHDTTRNILYITDNDSVLRYQMDSGSFLPPYSLGGRLRGIDLSPGNDFLVVADQSNNNGRLGFYLVDLKTGTNSRVEFRAEMQESGTYSVVFDSENAVWLTTSLDGSGWVPMRKYSLATRSMTRLDDVSQDTMLCASADRKNIAFAQAGVTPGSYGRVSARATRLPQPLKADGFLYEIGISRDGAQMAAPGYNKILLAGSAVPELNEREAIGVVYHPKRDYVFITFAGSPTVAVYETANYTKVKEFDFGEKFEWTGGHAYESGRLRLSNDGSLLFCTVRSGVSWVKTGL
jgi:DNA-binding beta-propeller fold protein YncE